MLQVIDNEGSTLLYVTDLNLAHQDLILLIIFSQKLERNGLNMGRPKRQKLKKENDQSSKN